MSNPDRKLRLLEQGSLRRLSFLDNFEGFLSEVTIPAATELAVKNQFRDARVPRFFLILDDIGQGIIKRGATDWTKDFVYLQNISGGSEAHAFIFFLR